MVTGNSQVLVVDDEPLMCNILQRILTEAGYKVITASNGQAALKLVKTKKPDVILLDLVMPELDGREVCRRVRELSTASRIIYLTGKAAPTDPSESKELRREADAFISKPATSRLVLSKVRAVMQSTP